MSSIFLIREGKKDLRKYGALFTCMGCSEVNIERTCNMDTDSFMQALQQLYLGEEKLWFCAVIMGLILLEYRKKLKIPIRYGQLKDLLTSFKVVLQTTLFTVSPTSI